MIAITSATTDEQIKREADRVAYASGIKALSEIVQRLLKLERDSLLDRELKLSGYR